MEDKKNKQVPEKNTKKPTGKSATGKPLDGIDINPQLDDKRRTNENFAVLAASLQERKALTIAQRQQRSRQLKRIEPKLKRAKEISQSRLAGPKKLQARAEAKARAFLKSRVSTRKDVPYAQLTTSEKIQVDTAVAKKTKLIKRLAARLLPKLRKAEFERLKSFHSGEPMKSLHTAVAAEEFSNLFNDLNDKSTLELVDIIENSIVKFEQENNPLGLTLRKMLNSTIGTDPITETLIKKSEKAGIPFSTLKEVFERGASLYVEESNQTQEQVAFNRVNSYIAKGRAWNLDADLREKKSVNEQLNNTFNKLLESTKEIVDRPPPSQKAKKRHQELQKKIIDEAGLKWNISVARPRKNKTPVRTFISIVDEIVIPAKHLDRARDIWKRTKDINAVKKFVSSVKEDCDTQPQNDNLNETFNMVWTAGIGVTLSAEECGIKMKPSFELHPDVIDAMEEVRSADVEGVVVRTADGKTIVRRQKRNKKIIGSGNVNDGKPDDTL